MAGVLGSPSVDGTTMTLSSQTSRPNAGRKYMVSRKRRARKWPWIAVVVLAAGLLLIFQPWSSRPDAAANGEASSPASSSASSSNGTDDNGGDDRGIEATTPRLRGAAEEADPDVPGAAVTPTPVGQNASARGSEGGGERANGRADDARDRGRGGESSDRVSSRFGVSSSVTSEEVAAAFAEGRQYIEQGRLVEGRSLLSALLFDPARPLPEPDAGAVRDMLSHVNETLVFSPEVVPGDPVAERYRVQRGDVLARVAPQYGVPYQFLERINQVDARRLQAGQPIKVINGPFHARIVKGDYRMDVFLRGPDGLPIYVKSYPVGLGEADSTPIGLWRIEPGKKVTNPDWRNPRTGEYFRRDDPDNPIGEYWLALEGIDDRTRGVEGYGIHGTVDPDSIGEQASMGCIRLRNSDVEEVFHMFVGGESTVEILR